MQRETRGSSQSSDDEELNTEQQPLLGANNQSASQQDKSTTEDHPLPDDTTPLLDSASPRRDYRAVSPLFGFDGDQDSLGPVSPNVAINSDQESLRPISPNVAINGDQESIRLVLSRSTVNDLERSFQTPQPTILEDEEDENQLTASLPSTLGLHQAEAGTGQEWRGRGVFPLTDTGDNDETFQAKLLAVRKEARHRRKLRKTISGALDITEDVSVALLGNPNLAEACHHSPAASQPESPRPSVSQPTSQGVFTCNELCFGY